MKTLWTRGRLHILCAVLCCGALCASGDARAQGGPKAASAPSGVSVRDAIARGVRDGAGSLSVLKTQGVTFSRVLVVEPLGRGERVLVEGQFQYRGRALRLPMKLERVVTPGCAGRWRLMWAPHKAYLSALLAILSSNTLPSLPRVTPWASVGSPRVPAMPIIVTRKRMFTALGPIPSRAGVEQTVALTGVPEIDPPALLVQHAQYWAKKIVEEDESAAAFDLIAEEKLSWRRFNQALIGLASQGFYRARFVVRGPSGFGVLPTTAPVFGTLPGEGAKKPTPLVVALYPQTGTRAAFRLSVNGALIPSSSTCPTTPGVKAPTTTTFCADAPSVLKASLDAALATHPAQSRARMTFATFGTTRDVTLAQALPWLHALSGALGVPARRVFVSYVRMGGPT